MKFTTTIIAALMGTATAFPSHVRRNNLPEGSILAPTTISLYHVKTGEVEYDVGMGKIYKSTSNNGADITTLVTFEYPDYLADKMCYFTFDLLNTDTLTGSERLDVFTSSDTPTHDMPSWPQGNLRDQHLGRLHAVLGGRAEWEQQYFSQPFPCPAGEVQGGELVGVYDDVDIEWDNYASGPRIHYY